MSHPVAATESMVTLRQHAQQQLAAGTAPATRGWGVGVEALALLHRLASAPDSAADAQKLLHELQVHQVELDLQQAQLEANEHELADELARYRGLYEQAPIAQLVLDGSGRIVECNRAGVELLDSAGSEISGRRLDEFLSSDSSLPLAALLRDAKGGAGTHSVTIRPGGGSGDARHWRLVARAVATTNAIQLVITDSAGSPAG